MYGKFDFSLKDLIFSIWIRVHQSKSCFIVRWCISLFLIIIEICPKPWSLSDVIRDTTLRCWKWRGRVLLLCALYVQFKHNMKNDKHAVKIIYGNMNMTVSYVVLSSLQDKQWCEKVLMASPSPAAKPFASIQTELLSNVCCLCQETITKSEKTQLIGEKGYVCIKSVYFFTFAANLMHSLHIGSFSCWSWISWKSVLIFPGWIQSKKRLYNGKVSQGHGNMP